MPQGQMHPWGCKGMLEYFVINLKAFKVFPSPKARAPYVYRLFI